MWKWCTSWHMCIKDDVITLCSKPHCACPVTRCVCNVVISLEELSQRDVIVGPWHVDERRDWHRKVKWPVQNQIREISYGQYAKVPRWQGATIRGPITEVKQPWAWLILGWVTVQDTVLVAKDVIVTCHVPLWLMSYEHTRGSQSAP